MATEREGAQLAPSRGSQAKRLHSAVSSLIQHEKVDPETIAVLVPGQDHSAFYGMLTDRPLPRPARWAVEEFGRSSGVRLETVQRFKGLEASVLFLWGVDEIDPLVNRELLYVTLSRAKSRLFLVGRLDRCQEVLGGQGSHDGEVETEESGSTS